MEQNKKDVNLGRFISLILRHKPETIGIQLDENGWADVNELITGVNQYGKNIDREDLERIVRENSKKRYIFNKDKTKIRANQGHSLNVEIELKQAIPPNILYHGTGEKSVQSIQKSGINKRNRQFVHLSAEVDTAINVGSRHGKPIVFQVNSKQMYEDGYVFYLSENMVWLCDEVRPQYCEIISIKSE